MREQLVKALGMKGASLTNHQEELLEQAADADLDQTLRMIENADSANNPTGAIVNGAKRIVQTEQMLGDAVLEQDRQLVAKRIRSMMNYARTSLAQMPEGDREDELRKQYPGLPTAAWGAALELAAAPEDPDAEMVNYELGLAAAAYRRRVDADGEQAATTWLRRAWPGYTSTVLSSHAHDVARAKGASRIDYVKEHAPPAHKHVSFEEYVAHSPDDEYVVDAINMLTTKPEERRYLTLLAYRCRVMAWSGEDANTWALAHFSEEQAAWLRDHTE